MLLRLGVGGHQDKPSSQNRIDGANYDVWRLRDGNLYYDRQGNGAGRVSDDDFVIVNNNGQPPSAQTLLTGMHSPAQKGHRQQGCRWD